MCKYGYKTENARFGMRAAIAKQVRGDAAPRRRRKLCFLGGLLSQSARLCRYGSSSQKVLRYFLGALFVRFSVFDSVRLAGRVLVSAPARGSARVTGRRQPPRQRSRRLVQDKHTSRSHTRIFTAYRPNKRRRETFPKRCVPLFGYDYSQTGQDHCQK